MKLAEAHVDVDMNFDNQKNRQGMASETKKMGSFFGRAFASTGRMIKSWVTPLNSALEIAGKISAKAQEFEERFKGYQQMAVQITNFSKLTGGDPLRFGALASLAAPFNIPTEQLGAAIRQSLVTMKGWRENPTTAPVKIRGNADPISTMLSVFKGVANFDANTKASILQQMFGEVGTKMISLANKDIFKKYQQALDMARSLGVTKEGLKLRGEKIAEGDTEVFLNRLSVASRFSTDTFDVGTALDVQRAKRDLASLQQGGIGIKILKTNEQMSKATTAITQLTNVLVTELIPFLKNIGKVGLFDAIKIFGNKVGSEVDAIFQGNGLATE